MLNLICNLVSKIVFTGINGTILIVPLMVLLYVLSGQVKDVKQVAKQILREGR